MPRIRIVAALSRRGVIVEQGVKEPRQNLSHVAIFTGERVGKWRRLEGEKPTIERCDLVPDRTRCSNGVEVRNGDSFEKVSEYRPASGSDLTQLHVVAGSCGGWHARDGSLRVVNTHVALSDNGLLPRWNVVEVRK